MNNVYRTPLFTSWPTPLSLKDLGKCFSVGRIGIKKAIRLDLKNFKSLLLSLRNIFSATPQTND